MVMVVMPMTQKVVMSITMTEILPVVILEQTQEKEARSHRMDRLIIQPEKPTVEVSIYLIYQKMHLKRRNRHGLRM